MKFGFINKPKPRVQAVKKPHYAPHVYPPNQTINEWCELQFDLTPIPYRKPDDGLSDQQWAEAQFDLGPSSPPKEA